jgi:hypothetical protein
MTEFEITESASFRRGVMALRGGRFEEAEEHFLALAEQSEAPMAWAAVGKAKLWRVPAGEATVNEVAYCFDLAKRSCTTDEENEAVDAALGSSTIEMIAHLYDLIAQIRAKGKEVGARTWGAVGFGALSAVVGTNSKSLFGSLASYSVFSRTIDSFEDSSDEADEIVAVGSRMIALLSELRGFLLTSGTQSDIAALAEFESKIAPVPRDIQQVADSNKPKSVGIAGSAKRANRASSKYGCTALAIIATVVLAASYGPVIFVIGTLLTLVVYISERSQRPPSSAAAAVGEGEAAGTPERPPLRTISPAVVHTRETHTNNAFEATAYPERGAEVQRRFCCSCGSPQSEARHFCVQCGTKVDLEVVDVSV